ncbi:MAG: putative membrane protein YphA (DoxX/SURF4 family) [Crocinitomicaceae bacterium]|jgi:uncharacterized membrane protein YphA (DoxX/SURF4 family)
METIRNRAAGILIIRLVLGFIFLMQGFGKIFSMGVDLVHYKYFAGSFKDILPESITYATAYYTSYVELLGGLLLLIGFKRDLALYFLGSVLIIVSFGHGLLDPTWGVQDVLFRLMLLAALLLLPKTWDTISIDSLLARRKGKL